MSYTTFRSESKQLAIVIYDFLLGQQSRKDLSRPSKDHIIRAANCLEKVYRIRFTDYVFNRHQFNLRDLFRVGRHPVPVQNRIRAEKHKAEGNMLMDARAYKQAEDEYSIALQLNKNNPVYFRNRSAARALQGLVPTAIEDCIKALELDPQYVKAYSLLGLIYTSSGHPARALRCYKKALKIEPRNEVCLANVEKISNALGCKFLLADCLSCRNLPQLTIGSGVFGKKCLESLRYKGEADKLPLEDMD